MYSYGLPLNKLIRKQTLLQTNQKITSPVEQDDPRTDKQLLCHIQSEHKTKRRLSWFIQRLACVAFNTPLNATLARL